MSDVASSGSTLTLCRGFLPGRCRFSSGFAASDGSVADMPKLEAAAHAVVASSGWDAFLVRNLRGPLLQHHTFKISLSACPNGCSRPHVADVGLIRAVLPGAVEDACTACGLCIRQCPDHALTPFSGRSLAGNAPACATGDALPLHGVPVLDAGRCLACGLCIRRCPERALPVAADGWRILLGGRLGRHPRLATPLAGIHDTRTALGVIGRALAWQMREYRPGLRFADLVAADARHGAFLLDDPASCDHRDSALAVQQASPDCLNAAKIRHTKDGLR